MTEQEHIATAAAALDDRHAGPQTQQEHIMQFFAYEHLPTHLQSTSQAFHSLAMSMIIHIPRNPERTVALRKLLEAKDAAVRAVVAK